MVVGASGLVTSGGVNVEDPVVGVDVVVGGVAVGQGSLP